ncbi:MAG: class I SAM-dependent methyltransferase [Ruminococcus sp.]|nr:class I SAM-dependent methyltransferase [Ruminococcus sp.]
MSETGYEIFSCYYDALTENVNFSKRAAYFDVLIQKYLCTSGSVLLDLACSTSTMAEQMAQKGYDVIGVDYSSSMLGQAMEKKLKSGLSIQYVQQDMQKLDLYGTVDITICTLDSLNHLPDFESVQRVFQKVADATECGGVFLFDMNTLYKHRVSLNTQVYVYETDDVYCVWKNALQSDQCTVEIDLELFQKCSDGRYRRQTEHITERAYPTEEIREALCKVGFSVIGIYHADTEEPLKADSERMVLVARKEK